MFDYNLPVHIDKYACSSPSSFDLTELNITHENAFTVIDESCSELSADAQQRHT